MSTATTTSNSGAAIWKRVLGLDEELTPTAARALLKLQFSDDDRQRMRELAAKARTGMLSPDDERDADTYERLGCLLDILHSKARRALKRRRKAS